MITFSYTPNMPEIRNPVLPTETFNRHWDQTKYANFRNRVNSHARTAKKAKEESSSENAVKIWRELFGENFGKGSGGIGGGNGGGGRNNPPTGPRNNPSGVAAPAVVIPRVVTPRKPYAR